MELDLTSSRYPHVVEAAIRQPWAILPEKLLAIAELVQMRVDGFRLDPQATAEIAAQARRTPARSSGATAVLPLYGTLLWRVGALEKMSGATSLMRWGAALDAALEDGRVDSIVIDVDSPGGEISGLPETAAKLFAARGRKPITAVVNTLSASAAYWLSAAADEIVMSPSGLAGSVGVYMLHQDISGAAEKAGVKMSFVEAPKDGFKTEGNQFEPLSDEARAYAQERVNEVYDWFVADLARFRGVSPDVVREQFGQGRVVGAEDALARGMADRIATLEEVLQEKAQARQNDRRPARAGTERDQRVAFEISRRMNSDSAPGGASTTEQEVVP